MGVSQLYFFKKLANLIFRWHLLERVPNKWVFCCSQGKKERNTCTQTVGDKSYIIKNENTTQFSMTFV